MFPAFQTGPGEDLVRAWAWLGLGPEPGLGLALQLDNLREFVKTHVILAPLREFSRSRAASKIPFPGAQAGWPGQAGEPEIFHFRCKNRYLRSRVI